MRSATFLLLPLHVLFLPLTAHAGASVFVAGGAAGTTTHGFRGGWGAAAGVEVALAPTAGMLIRFDHHDLPDAEMPGPIIGPIFDHPGGVTALGAGPSPARAFLRSAMLGLRLHPPAGRVRTYLDALVGVGHLDLHHETGDPRIRDDTNLALSFGAGLSLGGPSRGRMFVDAHLDYYLVEGMDSPLVPVRMGFAFP